MSATLDGARAGDGLVAVTLWDREDRLVAVDDAYFDFYPQRRPLLVRGRNRAEILRAALALESPFASQAAREAQLREALGGSADGQGRVIEAGARSLHVTESRTPDGGRIAIHVDVTATRTTARRLASVDALLRDGLESMADGVSIWDAEDRLVLWNAQYERMHEGLRGKLRPGLGYAEAVALLTPAVFRAWDPAQCARWTAERVALHRNCVSPREYVRADGTTIEILERRTSEGGIVAVFRDVTAARDATRALARSEAQARRLALVAAHARSAIAILDAQGAIEWINPAFTELTGWSEAEAGGQDPLVLLRDPFADGAPEAALRAAVGEGRALTTETLERRRDGSSFWSQVELVPVCSEAGAVERFICLRSDITARKRDEAVLQRALRMERELNAQQRRFISMASHEFRTPLAIIDGARQRLAVMLGPVAPEITKRFDRIRDGVSRITLLLDRMLSTAAIDVRAIESERRRLDLRDEVRAAVDRARADGPDFEFVVDLADDTLPVHADPALLERVFFHLLSNATKYSGPSRRVEVSARRVGAAAEIRICDFGIGIPAGDLPKLFSRYFRSQSAAATAGTGSGLRLCRDVLDIYGGRIAIESEPGRGCCVTVVLPCAP